MLLFWNVCKALRLLLEFTGGIARRATAAIVFTQRSILGFRPATWWRWNFAWKSRP